MRACPCLCVELAFRGRVLKGALPRPRFPIHVPLLYRPLGNERWRAGRTENVSCTGVLFRAEALLDLATPIELAFELPIGPSAPLIVCVGKVIRTDPSLNAHGQPTLAATIAQYRFVRRAPDASCVARA
jgi:PilZ domain-containing protein